MDDAAHVFAFTDGRLVTRETDGAPQVPTRRLTLGAGAAVLALVVFLLPAFTATRYADYSLQTFGVHRHSYKIEHDGRVFYYGKADRAAAANMVIAAAAKISRPGQRLTRSCPIRASCK